MRKRLTIILSMVLLSGAAGAQVKFNPDTLDCAVIGFGVGTLIPGGGTASSGMAGGNMKDLYSGAFLNFNIGADYKFKSNWLATLDADLWFGLTSDNLRQREERMSGIYTETGLLMSWGGVDGVVTAYNRGLAARVGGGKVLTVLPQNPNSGILLKFSGGWMMQKTVFTQDMNESPVPQINGEYRKLYDHLRNGVILTEGIGFVYMSNLYNYVNVKVVFEVSECMSWSSRPWQLDDYMGLNGKDHNRYFDLMYGIKLSWMFPLMGKTTYDYYYY